MTSYTNAKKVASPSSSCSPLIIILVFNMGRSAKVAKRPTKKEKVASKTSKESRKPLPPPPPPRVIVEKDEGDGPKGMKKRRTMRAKVDQVSLDPDTDGGNALSSALARELTVSIEIG